MLALRDHMQVDDKAAIGYLDYSPEARKELAKKSRSWRCPACHGSIKEEKQRNSQEEQKKRQVEGEKIGMIGLVSGLIVLLAIMYYLWKQ